MLRSCEMGLVVLAGILMPVASVSAQVVTIDLVTVGDPGNAPDTRYNSRSVGAVAATYAIGKNDVTTAQYCAFLNAVAATDTYGLYNTSMYSDSFGCKIRQLGASGSYTYLVDANGDGVTDSDWVNRPVNYVSWGDAVRFANWMNNGQPAGAQNLLTTEDGAYYLNGATSIADLTGVTRKAGATWWIPSEDEWHKAAYYDPNKPGGAGYWEYPTKNNIPPSNIFSTAGTNNANYCNGGFMIGSPYYRTEAGALAGSPGPYGTLDQGGNVWQWNDTSLYDFRGARGGSFNNVYPSRLAASMHYFTAPINEGMTVGFRLASVPEPSTIALILAGAISLLAIGWPKGSFRKGIVG
jgi:formylglycine-generating enzyme